MLPLPPEDFGGNEKFRQVWGARDAYHSNNNTLETHPGYKLWFPQESAEELNRLTADEKYRKYLNWRALYLTAIEYLAQVRELSKGSRSDPYTRERTHLVSKTQLNERVEWQFIHAFISHHVNDGAVLAGLADELDRLRRKTERKIEDLASDRGYARHSITLPVPPSYDARQQLLDETQQLVRRLELRVAAQKARSPGRPRVTDDQARLFALRERADELEQGLDLCFGRQ
ncbi:uncharacterized protein LOC62_05G007706 [Vanrija pseudolonga]|uniref:Uncharacterized protein n=1 Tax=Vanrija pseudolonga TaxID=143232 RepID=A0AAF0YG13_9TREE|nr:hypothetical protein LOC62_05G007706 [Vanrija pseudolonga]